jgi:[acyl-carrier-protein] S-malonyltransferase
VIVVVCPGQGSQTPGFLEPWLAEPAYRELVESCSQAAGIDLVEHGTTSDADTIRDTAIAQPLIVAAGLVTLTALREAGASFDGIAGHSVGEVTAAVGAEVLSASDGMAFVAERANAMAQAAAAARTGMSAVLGGDPEEVVAHVRELGLEPANYNGGGQIVVAGALEDLARLAEQPLRGTRVVPLQVAGAFHTRYMEPAREHLQTQASAFVATDPTIPLWTNRDGSRVTDGALFLQLLVGQVASPVRWDLCMESFSATGVTGLIELAPAGALVGLAKRGLKGVPTVAVRTPDDLPAALELIARAA